MVTVDGPHPWPTRQHQQPLRLPQKAPGAVVGAGTVAHMHQPAPLEGDQEDPSGLRTGAPLSSYDYAWAAAPPSREAVAGVCAAPLPELAEPTDQPPVVVDCGEPLVRIAHRRVRVLDVYWHAGWPDAVPGAWAREGTVARLCAAAESLPARFGLAVFDAWRPLELQRAIYQAAYRDEALPAGFVSEPSADPATPPPHLTGGAVDVTLTFDSVPLALGTAFDDFTARAHADALEAEPGESRDLRRLLYWTMAAAGFVVIDCEWWHFEHGTRRWAALTGGNPKYGPARPT